MDLKQLRPRVKLVIKLSSSSKDFEYENDILVSNQSGYLFLTTDRPVYRLDLFVEFTAGFWQL